MFLANCWYMAGWSEELSAQTLLNRRVAGQSVVLFRDETGKVAALHDRCPHRFAPLSRGKHMGDCLECPYHGLRFDGTGRCVHNPHGQGDIPPGLSVRALPVVERATCIWVWLGDPALADTALLPNFDCLYPAASHTGQGYLHARVNYVLEMDNIMDLSHIEFLHPGTLGSDIKAEAEVRVTQSGSTITYQRVTRGEILSEFLANANGLPREKPVDRYLEVRWDPPASMLLTVTIVAAGRPPAEGRTRRVANIFSPETETSTHYWYSVAYDKASLGSDGKAVAVAATESLRQPFVTEDLPMIEAVQEAMEGAEFWSLRPAILQTDAGAIRARRMLSKLIREEAGMRAEH